MITRDELKQMIDLLPDKSLEIVHTMLNHHLNPPPPPPTELERIRNRGREFRKLVEARFHETRKPGTITGMSGSGSSGIQNGSPYGRNSFQYWDDKAIVYQTLQSLEGHHVELMERFAIAPERTSISFTIEVSSGGRTVRFEEIFPIST